MPALWFSVVLKVFLLTKNCLQERSPKCKVLQPNCISLELDQNSPGKNCKAGLGARPGGCKFKPLLSYKVSGVTLSRHSQQRAQEAILTWSSADTVRPAKGTPPRICGPLSASQRPAHRCPLNGLKMVLQNQYKLENLWEETG